MQNQLDNKVYAGFFVRLVAFAIDSLLAAIVVSTIKSPFTMAAAAGVDLFKSNFLFHYSFLDVLDYVGVAAYFVLLTYFNHTTPGKAVMKLEVVTEEKDWTMLNVIYRETIGRFFSSLMCIGYFAVLVSEKKQGFHDMLCDTYVVYKGVVRKEKAVPVLVNQPTDTMVAPLEEDKNMADAVVAPTYYTMPVKGENFAEKNSAEEINSVEEVNFTEEENATEKVNAAEEEKFTEEVTDSENL